MPRLASIPNHAFSDGLLGLIDWEYASLGDPAHDLAIVTRGRMRPFQVHAGLERLVDAYNARAPTEVHPRDVRFFELSLMAGMYRDALDTDRPTDEFVRAAARILRQVDQDT